MAEQRKLIMLPSDILSIKNSFEESIGVGVIGALRRAGKHSAQHYSDIIIAKGLKGEEALKELTKMLEESGWFRASWEFNRRGEIGVRIYKSFESAAGNRRDGNCHFISGFLEEAVERLMNWENIYCQEMRCIARGDEFCEFLILR